ncbi:hypothetical protein G7046_g3665 [Stylonectria norvegica]|nr:hypothetical protein G7046_g3665 [Stylonectria norvegica]
MVVRRMNYKRTAPFKFPKETKEPKEPKAPAEPRVAPTRLHDAAEQQHILNVFSEAFSPILASEEFPTLLQEIKQALFNREFGVAFGREDYLEAYAARWSPTRALGYATVFLGIRKHLDAMLAGNDELPDTGDLDPTEEGLEAIEDLKIGEITQNGENQEIGENQEGNEAPKEPQQGEPAEEASSSNVPAPSSPSSSPPAKTLKMVSFGGCAAEQLAFASYIRSTNSHGTLTLVDSGPWSSVTTLLHTKTTSPAILSKYASAAAQASNTALLEPEQLSLTFAQKDALTMRNEDLAGLFGSEPVVASLLFTLNEMYTTCGIAPTTSFLKKLGLLMAHGSLLLVVDSPGSYSEATITKETKEQKRYPMQWLLDHTLVDARTPSYAWEKLESQDSAWFRLPESLFYPIQLENMRYQMHLYRLDKPTSPSVPA